MVGERGGLLRAGVVGVLEPSLGGSDVVGFDAETEWSWARANGISDDVGDDNADPGLLAWESLSAAVLAVRPEGPMLLSLPTERAVEADEAGVGLWSPSGRGGL